MIDLFLRPIRELVELLIRVGPALSKSKQRKLKVALARLYFLLLELRDSSVHLVKWLSHAERYSSPGYLKHALDIVGTVHAIAVKVTELMAREFADELTLSRVLALDDPELARKLHELIGGKLIRLRMWRSVLRKAAAHAEAGARNIESQDYPEDDSDLTILVPSSSFSLPAPLPDKYYSTLDPSGSVNLELVQKALTVAQLARRNRTSYQDDRRNRRTNNGIQEPVEGVRND